MWNELCDELPYWNRSQLSSSCDVDVDEDDEDEKFADAEPVDVTAAADEAMRARIVSLVPSVVPVAERALSSDSSRAARARSVARAAPVSVADAVECAVADDRALAEVDCGAGADRYGCSAASGTMMRRAASALMSVRPR